MMMFNSINFYNKKKVRLYIVLQLKLIIKYKVKQTYNFNKIIINLKSKAWK